MEVGDRARSLHLLLHSYLSFRHGARLEDLMLMKSGCLLSQHEIEPIPMRCAVGKIVSRVADFAEAQAERARFYEEGTSSGFRGPRGGRLRQRLLCPTERFDRGGSFRIEKKNRLASWRRSWGRRSNCRPAMRRVPRDRFSMGG